jgi:hypothetical protein
MKDKVEFLWVSPTLGDVQLTAHNIDEAIGALYDVGAVNIGEVKIVKRTYRWLCDEPHIVNLDYQ